MILMEVFPKWINGEGIFTNMLDVPWDSEISSQLNFDYYGNHSGSKTISPLVRRLLNSDGSLYEPATKVLRSIINTKFHVSWQMLWNSLELSDAYVPYENYNMTENVDKSVDTSETNSANDATNHGKTTDTDIYHYGFNSTEKQPSGAESVKDGGATVVTRSSSGDEKMKETSMTHRHGNIGVTTSQQMIESEIELRKKNFFEIVYSDVDSVLALKIYDVCKGGM